LVGGLDLGGWGSIFNNFYRYLKLLIRKSFRLLRFV
jgi:hypothetical protein